MEREGGMGGNDKEKGGAGGRKGGDAGRGRRESTAYPYKNS